MNWTTPADLRQQLQRHWNSGALLAGRLTDDSLFPLSLRLRKPTSSDVAEHFSAVRDWVQALHAGSREERGFGYALSWKRLNHRVHGSNNLPQTAFVPSERDALLLLNKTADSQRFDELAQMTLARFPQLNDWLARRGLTVLQHQQRWPQVLDVLAWFTAHPRPGIYLRQLDIAGVDTKFIEGQRGLFSELLDVVLPESAIDTAYSGARQFTRRYGLRAKSPRIRFRLLDPCLTIQGMQDMAVPAEAFARLELPVRRVFITENEINGLAFPDSADSLVIFGLGYGLDRLAEIAWLQRPIMYYWGDIDTHGFAILNRLRSAFPQSRSLLMDRATLDAHRHLWGQEPADRRFLGELPGLTMPEQSVFNALRDDALGSRVRMEQERVGFGWLRQAVSGCLPNREGDQP